MMRVLPGSRQRLAGLFALVLGVVILPLASGQNETRKKSPEAKSGLPGKPAKAALDFDSPVSLSDVNSPVLALAYAPDGQTFALAEENQTIQIRALPEGKVRHTLKGHADAVLCLAFAADGKTLASGSADRMVKLWDAATGAERRTLAGHTGWVYALAFSPDGKTLATAGYDKTIRLWDAASGKEQAILKGHKASIRALAFSADGTLLASGGSDRTIRLWDVAAQREPVVLKGHEGSSPQPGILSRWQDARQRQRRPYGAAVGCGRGQGAFPTQGPHG